MFYSPHGSLLKRYMIDGLEEHDIYCCIDIVYTDFENLWKYGIRSWLNQIIVWLRVVDTMGFLCSTLNGKVKKLRVTMTLFSREDWTRATTSSIQFNAAWRLQSYRPEQIIKPDPKKSDKMENDRRIKCESKGILAHSSSSVGDMVIRWVSCLLISNKLLILSHSSIESQ